MAFAPTPDRTPLWYLIPPRIVLVTFLLTLLSFALSLLLGILGILVLAWWRGARPDMTNAYRHIAAPVAAVVAAVVLIAVTVLEIKRYRQAKMLARIERAS
jgi:hypothetical protein